MDTSEIKKDEGSGLGSAGGECSGADKSAEVCGIWSREAADKMVRMVDECNLTNRTMAASRQISGNGSIAARAGFAAEELHKESFNLRAIEKGRYNVKAFTDRTPGTPIPKNAGVSDIVITEDGRQVSSVQSKFFATPGKTYSQFVDRTGGGDLHYKDADALLAPAEQLAEIRGKAADEIQSAKINLKDIEAAKMVQEKATDRLEYGGIKGRRFGKSEVERMVSGEDPRLHGKIQNQYKTRAALGQMGKSALGGAAIATVIAGTVNTFNCLRLVKEGKMRGEDAVKYILKNTAISATDSAAKAAAATGAVSLAANALPGMFKASMLGSSLATGAVGGAAICAVDIVECLVAVAAGKMTWKEMETRTGKNLFQVGAGVVGASIGGIVGSVGGPVGSAIGAIIGGMITSLAVTVAIENHIEKPFFENLENMRMLVDSEAVMNTAIEYLANAGIALEVFRAGIAISEKDFARDMSDFRRMGDENWKRIAKI